MLLLPYKLWLQCSGLTRKASVEVILKASPHLFISTASNAFACTPSKLTAFHCARNDRFVRHYISIANWMHTCIEITQIYQLSQRQKKATIHQLTTMLSISTNAIFPGHSHPLTIGVDDSSLIITLAGAWTIIKVSGHQHWWLWPGNRTFLETDSTVVSWWIVALLLGVLLYLSLQSFMCLVALFIQQEKIFRRP